MRIERFIFQIFLLVDKTRQIEQTNTESTTGSTLADDVKTGSTHANSLSRPEVRRLVNKWKWSQPSYQGEQTEKFRTTNFWTNCIFYTWSNFFQNLAEQISYLTFFHLLKSPWLSNTVMPIPVRLGLLLWHCVILLNFRSTIEVPKFSKTSVAIL